MRNNQHDAEMNGHLDNAATIRVMYGVAGNAEQRHAAECAACGQAVADAEAKRAAAVSTTAVSQLSGVFWSRQSAAILDRAAVPAVPLVRQLVTAASMAVLLVAALLLVGRPVTPRPQSASRANVVTEDDRLLREVYAEVSSIAPEPLAPAALLLPIQAANQTSEGEVQRP